MPFLLLLLAFLPLSVHATAPARCQAFLAAGRNVHIGQTTIPAVWGEPLTVKLEKDQLLALAWAQIRYRINPDYLLAMASKESRLNCQINGDGCFQIEPGGFQQLATDYKNIAGLTHTAVTDFGQGAVVAALHLTADRTMFRRQYDWDGFIRGSRDREASPKLLARAYNRGAWDQNIRAILTAQRPSCIIKSDVTQCYNDHVIARDHTTAVVSICRALARAPAHNPVIVWADVEQLLTNTIRPTEAQTRDWLHIIAQARARFDRLRGRGSHVPFIRIGPVLSTIAKDLPKP